MTSERQLPESLIKKRARDRRAQQNARNRRFAQAKALEDHVIHLETQMNSLHQTCDRLRIENLNLKGRQDMIRDMVQSWAPETHSTAPPLTPAFLGHSEHVAHRVGSSSSHTTFVSNYGDTVESAVPEGAHLTCQCSSEEPGSGQAAAVGNLVSTNGVLPPWKQIPVHDKDDIIVTDWFALWLNKPELARASPDSPRPIDILYGSKENFLANVLHLTSRKWPCRDPERLASGWLAYHLIKWMLEPTEKTFSRLCEFQRPVAEQFRYPHPYHIDFVVWPGLRANCVDYQYTYSCEQVAGMLTCCVKLRWPWNKPILEQDDNGQLQMCPDFYSTFTTLEGWGLTTEFSKKFPKLAEGLDSSVHYELS